MAFVPTKWCVPQTLTTEERKHDLAELISSKKIKLEPSVKYKKVFETLTISAIYGGDAAEGCPSRLVISAALEQHLDKERKALGISKKSRPSAAQAVEFLDAVGVPRQFGVAVYRDLAMRVFGWVERQGSTPEEARAGGNHLGWKRILDGATQLIAETGVWDTVAAMGGQEKHPFVKIEASVCSSDADTNDLVGKDDGRCCPLGKIDASLSGKEVAITGLVRKDDTGVKLISKPDDGAGPGEKGETDESKSKGLDVSVSDINQLTEQELIDCSSVLESAMQDARLDVQDVMMLNKKILRMIGDEDEPSTCANSIGVWCSCTHTSASSSCCLKR